MFTAVFGEGPDVKVLDFLAEHPEFDYSIMELSRHSDVARPTVYKVVSRLVKQGILVETRKIGNSTFYKLNVEQPRVRSMLELREGFGAMEKLGLRKGKISRKGEAKWSR